MENSSSSSSFRGRASFYTQANALFRKSLTFQKRNAKTNICIIGFPVVLCIITITIQIIVNDELNKPKNKCGCHENECGIQYSNTHQAVLCATLHPQKWPALLQVPQNVFRAVQSGSMGYKDLPDGSCKVKGSCPATILFTGGNKSFAEGLANNFFPVLSLLNLSNYLDIFSVITPGTEAPADYMEFIDPAFSSGTPLYMLQPICTENSLISTDVNVAGKVIHQEIDCVQGLPLWRDSTSGINDELYKGYQKGNSEGNINEFIAAYDFLNSRENSFNVNIWYNSTYNRYIAFTYPAFVRVPRSVNLAANVFLNSAKGSDVMMQLEYVKEMPQPERHVRLDFSSILGPLFFTWVIQLLFPVVLSYVVYEKEKKLRVMMKMHGLKDGPYWIISYAYFFSLSIVYILCFVIFGSFIGLKFFTLNSYSIQILFYFLYINLQIALAFLVSAFFSNVKTAIVVAYLYVFGSGLLGQFLLRLFIEAPSFPKAWIIVMELVPGFSLYRGLYELAEYAFSGYVTGGEGMKWRDLEDRDNGLKDVLVIMVVEWIILLLISYYLDKVSLSGGGIRKSCLLFLQYFQKKRYPSTQRSIPQKDSSKVDIEMDRPDVVQERVVVEKLILEPNNNYAMICDNLKKIYPGKDGNPSKFAVRGLSLALPRGECFGMLGPNGAGKTSFINMMIGLMSSTYGTAFVQGLDIRTSMEEIYSCMGVCPQHDLLWETLTGKEHLLFYGRLKNLKGAALMQAVDESLKSVNLFNGGVGNKKVSQYSGGMKRRLSVAISLIGDPKIVYMDEPSTGLDPTSRKNLWTVVKKAKANRAIILTTHSMEEAEFLCDRVGIFVDGSLQCIGNPKELKARYGGNYIFTVTTSLDREEEVEQLVRKLSPSASKIYHVSNTQKFEMPKQEIRIAEVFKAVDIAKSKLNIHAWGLVDTTLEDVFIKVAKGAQPLEVL